MGNMEKLAAYAALGISIYCLVKIMALPAGLFATPPHVP